jgi:DNA-directed RNA polymerase specialized sigma subunit
MEYVKNKEMLEELRKYKATGKQSEKLGEMFLLIARNLSNKNNFAGYTWKEEMISEAVITCVKYCKNFDPEKGNNPFAYFTRYCYNSFIGYIKKQNRHGEMKQTLYDKKDRVRTDSFYSYKSIDYTDFVDKK